MNPDAPAITATGRLNCVMWQPYYYLNMFSNERPAPHGPSEHSVYERALGEGFAALDPRLRPYFGRIPPGFEGVGSGIYREAGLRARALKPLFALLGTRRIAFADHGTAVPFTIRNVADSQGALRAVRTFHFPKADRTMVDSMQVADDRLVDRIGVNGEIEVELAITVTDGQVRMRSTRLALRCLGLRLRLPRIVSVTIREEARADGTQYVDVRMRMPFLGDVYGYSGTFRYDLRQAE